MSNIDENQEIDIQQILYDIMVYVLMIGASLIIGLLSFSGMFALWPILALASISFILSVLYEGEIFFQNINSALTKLFQPHYLEQHLSNTYLKNNFPTITDADCPVFFKLYWEQINLLHQLHTTETSAHQRIKRVEKTLREMETMLMYAFFGESSSIDDFAKHKQKLMEKQKAHYLNWGDYKKTFNQQMHTREEYQQLNIDQKRFEENNQHYVDAFNFLELESSKTWIAGCTLYKDIHTTSDDYIKKNPTTMSPLPYLEAYVLFQDDTIVYFNAYGEPETHWAIDTAHRKEASECLSDDKKERLTEAQLATLNTFLISDNVGPMLSDQARLKKQFENRYVLFQWLQAGSMIAGLFMMLGTSYLLVEAFSVIPLLAILPITMWPVLIVPMAVIAGIAYSLLIYNTITELVNNDSVYNWYKKLQVSLINDPWSLHGIGMLLISLFLFTLAIALTICTAGTWWTVVRQTQPIFAWMSQMPIVMVSILNAIITSLTTGIFNVENTIETLQMIDSALDETTEGLGLMSNGMVMKAGMIYLNSIHGKLAYSMITPAGNKVLDQITEIDAPQVFKLQTLAKLKPNILAAVLKNGHAENINPISKYFNALMQRENIWQIINPFRILLKLTVTPLRILLFLGHLISVGVTSDQLPGLPTIWQILLAMISEGFEDLHYFDLFSDTDEHTHQCDPESMLMEHFNHTHQHNHDDDFPSKILNGLFYPLFCLSALWDSQASQLNEKSERRVLTFDQALRKQYGLKPLSDEPCTIPAAPHALWVKHEVLAAIKADKTTAKVPVQHALESFEKDIITLDLSHEAILERVGEEMKKSIYQQQPSKTSWSFFGPSNTITQLEKLYNQLARLSDYGLPSNEQIFQTCQVGCC